MKLEITEGQFLPYSIIEIVTQYGFKQIWIKKITQKAPDYTPIASWINGYGQEFKTIEETIKHIFPFSFSIKSLGHADLFKEWR